MFTRCLSALALCVLAFSALAGGRGGHVTTFDANLFGGGWACIGTQASGTCGGATGHYSNAACDGVTNDDAAVLDFVTYGHALNPALVKLYIPSGCKLHLSAQCSFVMDASQFTGDTGIQNAIVWGYGATTDAICIGGFAYPNGTVSGVPQQALINTASAGTSQVTVNDGNGAIFSVGRWIAVTGLCIQVNQSGNPDHQFFEYRLITASTGGANPTLTLNGPLSNSYESTWPLLSLGDSLSPAQGGPAMIYLLEPTWNTNLTILGLTSTYAGQTNVIGRNIVIQDMVFATNGFAPSSSQYIWMYGSSAGSIEVDKNFENLTLFNVSIASQILSQSAAGNMNLSRVSALGLGTTVNTTATNSRFNSITAGPACCGAGNSLTLDGVAYGSAALQYHFGQISDYSFSGGTLTIAASNPVWKNSATALWVPGHKYYTGDTDGSDTCTGQSNPFTVSDVQTSGSNINITTNLAALPVVASCPGSRVPSTFSSYRIMSLTQKFTTGGGGLPTNGTLPP
jgi:hypothetical protein